MPSSVWKYFKCTNDRKAGICQVNRCERQIETTGGSTFEFHVHLYEKHNILLKRKHDEFSSDESNTSTETADNHDPLGIKKYFPNVMSDPLVAKIARLVAKDGISFDKIPKSKFLKKSFVKYSGFPNSENDIKSLVMMYGEGMRKKLINKLTFQTLAGVNFSLTLDKWASMKQKHFISVSIHSGEQLWRLGLIEIYESWPAEKCISILEQKLTSFKISLKKIVGITTDGTTVMKHFENYFNANHQLCMARGIQLAVIKVYNIKNIHSLEKDEEDNDYYDDSIDKDNRNYDTFNEEDYYHVTLIDILKKPEINPSTDSIGAKFLSLVSKIRKVVRIFQRSSFNNNVLQEYVKRDFKKNLSLCLDLKPGWNNLIRMLERFDKIIACVKKSLIDLGIDINFSKEEVDLLAEGTHVLRLIQLILRLLWRAEELSRADTIIKYMFMELSKLNTAFSKQLIPELIFNLKERRNISSDIIGYLNNTYKPDFDQYEIFYQPNENEIAKQITNLIKRLTNIDKDLIDLSRDKDEQFIDLNKVKEEQSIDLNKVKEEQIISSKESSPSEISLKTELQRCTDELTKMTEHQPSNNEPEKNLETIIRNEMLHFNKHKIQGKYLQLAYEYVKTIRPTTVNVMRNAFSSDEEICNEITTNLNYDKLDTLYFLRSCFDSNSSI